MTARPHAVPPGREGVALTGVTYETWPPRSVGGQQIGTTPGVKGTHEATGLSAFCSSERSQHRNRQIVEDMLIGGLTSPAFRGNIPQ